MNVQSTDNVLHVG